MAAQFDIYVKAASDGQGVGDCPFSQFVRMVVHLKIPEDQYTLIPVDINQKPPKFLELNPNGSVPVLVDTTTNQVIADSKMIVKFISEKFPEPDIQVEYSGPAEEACAGVFPKLAAFLKNMDKKAKPDMRRALEEELAKVDTYLQSRECPRPYLVSNSLCALDCSFLPKLRHVQVAGKHFQNFDIPQSLKALHQYMKDGEACSAFQSTAYDDAEIVKGWSRHGLVRMV